MLDAYLKAHNFSVFYPLLSLVCGDMAEDAAGGLEAGQLVEDLFQTASEALLHRWACGYARIISLNTKVSIIRSIRHNISRIVMFILDIWFGMTFETTFEADTVGRLIHQ